MSYTESQSEPLFAEIKNLTGIIKGEHLLAEMKNVSAHRSLLRNGPPTPVEPLNATTIVKGEHLFAKAGGKGEHLFAETGGKGEHLFAELGNGNTYSLRLQNTPSTLGECLIAKISVKGEHLFAGFGVKGEHLFAKADCVRWSGSPIENPTSGELENRRGVRCRHDGALQEIPGEGHGPGLTELVAERAGQARAAVGVGHTKHLNGGGRG